ncbi:2-aminoethylphosphonate--pyruvate transaminase [Brevibacillus sp. SYP-B805]|uniref:2-aminoethylphosphonate aminotransferase n=1 Tax=Brevibacillus sp. SYP-B805 TaxID=1578199 RepID=UPI0013ED913F|nr:2-aminoethylphosphonate--pyruvate transaminase [Brevibacillus sp. SYP-B805]NGQ93622.1 2-aminoethylphosphonate--pyruvate transaminase [Brevibacillus sp. SYP-B805]
MIKAAVILAAGKGSRMMERTKDRPKGSLAVDEKPIIEHSIAKLLACGIEKIVIGTGYKHDWYEQLAARYPQIRCVYNPHYPESGSMYTLLMLKDHIQEDFLLLESDLLYEKNALCVLLEQDRADVILAGSFSRSGDEVFIETDDSHHLVNLSKDREKLRRLDAELVGISKLSLSTYRKLCRYAEAILPANLGLDYEYALVGIAREVELYVQKLSDLAWCEVDDEDHWTRAVEVIYPIIKAREAIPAPVQRNILLNPGPATTTDTVKYAQVVPDICPREEAFGEVMTYLAAELTRFVADPAEYATVLFGGSGTAAVEAMISSAVGEGMLLIVNNGAYGMRMCRIADIYGLSYVAYNSPADDAIDLAALETFIQSSLQPIRYLAIVHSETTTGLLNDIGAVGEICRRHGIVMLVDAISSYAAIPIDMKAMHIHYLAASANKNLQGMAGVSFVIARRDQMEASRLIKPRNLYLHLYDQYQYFAKTSQMRFTPPVQTLYALKQAILETKWEGIEARYRRYCDAWETLIAGITRLGLTHLVPIQHHSKLITAIREPSVEGYNFQEMHDYFYRRGFTIYPGKLEGQHTFRVANIGAITHRDMERFLGLLEQYLQEIRLKNPPA